MVFNNACEAYWWVYDHPALLFEGYANPWIQITPHMVDPSLAGGIGEVNTNDPSKNTKMQFWIEAGPHVWSDICGDGNLTVLPSHDWDLDCGGWTWEEAVLNLAQLVLNKYGSY